jgi:hypothetical protein
MTYGKLLDPDRARQWYDRACAGMRESEPGHARLVRYRAEAASVLGAPLPTEAPERLEPHEAGAPGDTP